MFTSIRTKITLVSLLAVSLVGYGFYQYHRYVEAKMESLQLQLSQEQGKRAELEKTHENFKNNFAESAKEIERLRNDISATRREMSGLRRKIDSINLTEAGKTNPKVVEQQINDFTKDMFNRFEEMSGAKE